MIYKLLTRIKDTPEVVPHHQLSESSETYGTKHQYHIFLNVSRYMENSKNLTLFNPNGKVYYKGYGVVYENGYTHLN